MQPILISGSRDFNGISEDEISLVSNEFNPAPAGGPQAVHRRIQHPDLESGVSKIRPQCSPQTWILHDKEKRTGFAALMYLLEAGLDAAGQEEGIRYVRILFRNRSTPPAGRLFFRDRADIVDIRLAQFKAQAIDSLLNIDLRSTGNAWFQPAFANPGPEELTFTQSAYSIGNGFLKRRGNRYQSAEGDLAIIEIPGDVFFAKLGEHGISFLIVVLGSGNFRPQGLRQACI
jgi:hypothetical protein